MFNKLFFSRSKKNCVCTALISGLIVLLLVFSSIESDYENINSEDNSRQMKHKNDIAREMSFEEKRNCYRVRNRFSFPIISYLDDILEAKTQPRNSNSIFFVQTACSKYGIVSLSAR